MCFIWTAWNRAKDCLCWLCLQHPHWPVSILKWWILCSARVLRLWLLLQPIIQERQLASLPPVKGLVFHDRLLFSAFTTSGTLRVWGLDQVSQLISGRATTFLSPATQVSAFTPLRGPRCYRLNYSAACYLMDYFLLAEPPDTNGPDFPKLLANECHGAKTNSRFIIGRRRK